MTTNWWASLIDWKTFVEEYKNKLSPAAYIALTFGSHADEYADEFRKIYYASRVEAMKRRLELRAHPPVSALCADDCAPRSTAPPKKSHSRA